MLSELAWHNANDLHAFVSIDLDLAWAPSYTFVTQIVTQKLRKSAPAKLTRKLVVENQHVNDFRYKYNGAAEKTRTSTGFTPQRPQRCASTNSATAAH